MKVLFRIKLLMKRQYRLSPDSRNAQLKLHVRTELPGSVHATNSVFSRGIVYHF